MANELPKRNIVSFSGGKDSTALIIWAKDNLDDFETVWMDTGWEHPLTYGYVDYIDQELLNGNLRRLKSSEYEGFEDLAMQKGRVPSTKARFCTQKLKLEPLIEYFDTIRDDFEIHNYVGIRADESYSRSKMPECNFDLDYYGCWIHRPLLKWTADDIFAIMKKNNIEPNPLYKMGMKRVGCMPCIMSNHTDMKSIIMQFPEVIDEVRELEQKLGRSFFPPNYIPDRYCSRHQEHEIEVTKEIDDPMFGKREVTVKKKKTSWYPMIDDVVKYLKENPNQVEAFNREPQSCMSHYAICE
jgi:3'-phosphoadenosine 5'-phosphosulfate sulfotransferase (PAPS reductase)/FAD synthetase